MIKEENCDHIISETKRISEKDVIKLDETSVSNCDYGDIVDSEDEQETLELEELTDDTAKDAMMENQKNVNEKLKLLTKEMEKLKSRPGPATTKSNFLDHIEAAFVRFLPASILSTLTASSCGLCHEDFTSEGFAWKHYTGFNHKRTLKYFINGTYKDHPSFYNMVLDTIYRNNPKPLSESNILEIIKKKHPSVGENDELTMKLIRQKGLSRLLQIEYVVKKDGKYTATQALFNRKKRSKDLRDKIKAAEPGKYPEPVHLQDSNTDNDQATCPETLNQDLKQFKAQIFDFSKSFLPTSVISTLTQEHCGLCKLDIFCKPWSHYTGAGHRTTVELYQEGTYLGHPPYPTMVDRYIKEMKPTTLDEDDLIKYLKKNFNVGDDIEKVKARVEKCVETLGRKNPGLVKMKTKPHNKNKFPSENLIWFKKDLSKELKMASSVDKERTVKEDRNKDDLRNKLSRRSDSSRSYNNSGRINYVNKESSPRDSSRRATKFEVYRERSRDRSRRSGMQKIYSSLPSHSLRNDERRYGRDIKHQEDRIKSKNRTPESERRRQRSPETSNKRNSRIQSRYSRSPANRTRSPRRKERSPCERRYRSSRSPESRKRRSSGSPRGHSRREKEADLKRSRRSSRHHADPSYKKERRHSSSKSPKKPVGRYSKYSYGNDSIKRKESSAHQSKLSRGELPAQSSLQRPASGGEPLPTPPPDLLLPTPSTQHNQQFPQSFLTQHPQFPHVFIMNPMGTQMGGQIMMPVSLGQQNPAPNQPPL